VTKTPALDALVASLLEAFERPDGPTGGRIAELLKTYSGAHDDWRPWALFDAQTYTRNLVYRDERFELLILCWGAGQVSPIHNHEGQDCWMAVLDGEVEETRYCTPAEVRPGPLEPHNVRTYTVGQVEFIHDDIALHLVRSARSDADAVSLHLYAAPYDACDCYCGETGQVTRKRLRNHSERGRLLSTSRA
jgi:cysteine dioxygenase